MAKRVKIPGRLESAETGNIVTGADAVMDDEKGKTQVVINSEVDAAIINLAQGKQDNLTFDSAPTEGSPNPVTSAGVYTADKVLSDAIEAILLLIPSAASALNKLVDMQTMNSSIATATASFKGTYNLVSDLHLGVDATHEQIGAALDALSLGADNNDYAFVQVPNSATAPTEISKTERYKFNGENWLFEYDLNNSGFTQGQWNAINSGVTSLLVGKLSDLPTNAELTNLLAGKQDNLTFDNVPTAGSTNPVKSGGVYARNNEIVALINALDAAKQDVLTFDNAPVEGSPNPVKSGGVYTAISAVQAAIVALDAEKQHVLTFDSTPTLGSANPVTSSGIKTELNRIDGNITVLDNLYRALTQSSLVIVQPSDTWPVASPDATTIYRVIDRDHTPPQYYSDYMFSGSTPVLMAQYDNAIDDVPTAGSNNLVKSGGVYEECLKSEIPLLPISDCSPRDTFINGSNMWESTNNEKGIFIPCNGGEFYELTTGGNNCIFSFLTSKNDVVGTAPDYATGASRVVMFANNYREGYIPEDAIYIWVSLSVGGNSWAPSTLIINGYDYIKGLKGYVDDIVFGNVTESIEVSKIVRELYVSSLSDNAISSVKAIRVLKNNNGLWGISLWSSYPVVDGKLLEIYQTVEPKDNEILKSGDNAAIVDFSDRSISSTFKDYPVSLSLNVKNINKQPRISAFFDNANIGQRTSVLEADVLPFSEIEPYNVFINSSNLWENNGAENSVFIPVKGGEEFYISSGSNSCIFAFLKSDDSILRSTPDYATGASREVMSPNSYRVRTIPSDTKYVWVSKEVSGNSWSPTSLIIDGYDYVKGIRDYIETPDIYNVSKVVSLRNVVKEMYLEGFTSADLSQIKAVRIFKGLSNLWGFRLYKDTGFTEGLSLYCFTSTEEPTTSPLVLYADYSDKKACIIIDWDAIPSGLNYYDISGDNILEDAVIDLDRQPKIKELISVENSNFFDGEQMSFNYAGEKPIIYNGDTKANSDHIVNAVSYPNGVIIAARDGGSIVRINYDGTEDTLLTIERASDWRCLFMDKDLNVYTAPHGSYSGLGQNNTARGLYRLAYGQNNFVKVISLYDPESSDPLVAEENDDTIWNMCEDKDGVLYAGVYAHTVRPNPSIYRSLDGGVTWTRIFNFKTSGKTPDGLHIHSLIYNEFDDSLYVIVGEVNTVFRSTDKGEHWTDLFLQCEQSKGTVMLAVPDGVIIGSDGQYDLVMCKMNAKRSYIKTTAHLWANTVFALRRSDITGWIYAFTKIDGMINSINLYPPVEAINSSDALQAWLDENYSGKSWWQGYNSRMEGKYPADAVRPQHYAILISRDNGESWEVLKKYERLGTDTPDGFWTIGQFKNGECLAGRFENGFVNPVIISEGKHKFASNGIDLTGEILIKTNSSSIIG